MIFNLFYTNEIKNRIGLMFLFYITILISFVFNKENILFEILNRINSTINHDKSLYFLFTEPLEILTVYIKIIFFFSDFFLHFFLTYQISSFFATALTIKTFNYLKEFFFICLLSLNFSFLFFIYATLPSYYLFLLSFSKLNNESSPFPLFFEPNVLIIICFFFKVFLNTFWLINLNLIMIWGILTKKLLGLKDLIKQRRIFFLAFLLTSSFFFPLDVTLQTVFLVCSYLVFECSIFFRIYIFTMLSLKTVNN